MNISIIPTSPLKIWEFFKKYNNKNSYEDYQKQKLNWKQSTMEYIDWQLMELHIKQLPVPQKIQYLKFTYKWRPTQKRLHYTNQDRCTTPTIIYITAQTE